MNIFVRELRANLKSLIIWAVIVFLFISVGFSKFSAYYGNPDLLAILESMPSAMIEMLNIKAFNLTTITGFFGVMFTYFALLLSISAAMWGSDIIAKEENDKTVEFALTLPVRRTTLVTAKILAALVNCIVLNVLTWGIVQINAPRYNPDSKFYQLLSLSMVALFIMQLIFLAVGVFLGCAMKQHRRAASVAVSLLLVSWILSVIADLDKDLEFLKYVSPFKYFNPAVLLNEGKLDLLYISLSVGIIAVCLIGAYLTYSRRDLYI